MLDFSARLLIAEMVLRTGVDLDQFSVTADTIEDWIGSKDRLEDCSQGDACTSEPQRSSPAVAASDDSPSADDIVRAEFDRAISRPTAIPDAPTKTVIPQPERPDRQTRIVECALREMLRAGETPTSGSISRRIGLDSTSVCRALCVLKKRGIAQPEGKRNGKLTWVLCSQPPAPEGAT